MTARENRFTYIVEGLAPFPFDMLRYDSAWPASETESGKLEAMHRRAGMRELFTVQITGLSSPTMERWRSFGWRVLAERVTA